MDKKLKDYSSYIKTAKKHPSPQLLADHVEILRGFQHERLIHLIVTMFFALFLILFFIFTSLLAIFIPASIWGDIFTYASAFITLILFTVTLFYIRHYYQLENGVQTLESYTRDLQTSLSSSK